MSDLIKKVTELLNDKTIDVFIGYEKGSAGRIRAIFARNEVQAQKLIFDESCTQNLAGYLLKHEIKKLGKLGILANVAALRSIMQLASEFQIKDGEVYVLFANAEGSFLEFTDFHSIEAARWPDPEKRARAAAGCGLRGAPHARAATRIHGRVAALSGGRFAGAQPPGTTSVA